VQAVGLQLTLSFKSSLGMFRVPSSSFLRGVPFFRQGADDLHSFAKFGLSLFCHMNGRMFLCTYTLQVRDLIVGFVPVNMMDMVPSRRIAMVVLPNIHMHSNPWNMRT